jgi:F-type H+-transporting ATPase subunit alpha
VPIDQIRRFEAEFLRYMDSEGAGVLESIARGKILTKEIEEALAGRIADFKKIFVTRKE